MPAPYSAVLSVAIAVGYMSGAIAQPVTGAVYAQGSGELDPVLPDPIEDDFLTPTPDDSALDSEDLEADLGEIRVLSGSAPSQAARRQPVGQLLLRSSAFTTSNATASDLTPTGDTVFNNQATLLLTPKLGPNTRLIATAGGGLTQFATEGDNNYSSLGLSVGVQQRLDRSTYAQFGWVHDQLFDTGEGDRLLTDNSARLLVGRQDQLAEKLRLDTAYELRARFTDPADRSRISNSLGLRLRYDLADDWQGALGYRLALSDYTQNGRFDTTHQLQATTTYTPTQDVFVTGYASYLFGNSSATAVELENLSFGIGVGVNLPLF